MPISHKSYIHQPVGYTTPVDLNLLGRVLQFKQGQFDTGVRQTQEAINNIASLDVVRDVDKQYLNAKLNNLVSTINNIGGVDYSDPNVSNQIAGLSSQIYSDPNIQSAVANTKLFRYTQQYYKDLKEKKPKEWSPANQWYDMNKFSNWLMNGTLGTSPEAGAGQTTPYYKYEDDWQKMFDKIVQSANITTEITDKGLMYYTSTQKQVSPERIWEVAQKMLDPRQRQQIGIEGRFTYNNLPTSELARAYDEQTYNKVADAQGQLIDYRAKLKGATDPADQDKYQQLIREKEAEVAALVAPIQKNAEQIKESLYLNEKLKGLQARYAFNQTAVKMTPASDKMFKLNYELSKQKFGLDYAEFQYAKSRDNADREARLAIAGLQAYTDMFGNRTYLKLSGTGKKEDLDYSNIPGLANAGEDNTQTFTGETLNTRKETLVKANEQLFQDFVRDLGRKKGLSDVIVSDLLDDGNIQAVVDPEMKKAAQDMMTAWNAMTRGEKINYESLDPLFKSFAGKYQQNVKEMQAIDSYQSNIDKQVRTEFGVSADQLAAYDEYSKAQSEYFKAISTGNNQVITSAQSKLAEVTNRYGLLSNKPVFNIKKIQNYIDNGEERRNALISSADVALNLQTMDITDDKEKRLAKLVAQAAGTTQWYDESGNPIEKRTLNFESIELMNRGYSYLKTADGVLREPTITFKYKTDTGPEDYAVGKVKLTPTQAGALGFGSGLTDLTGYNFGLQYNGEVKDINTTSGKSYDLKYDIVKYTPGDQNDPSVFLRVRKGDTVISMYNRPFPTYQQAIQFMESAARLKSIDEAYKYITELAK